MISAVIIIKNGEQYLKECLDSLTSFEEVVLVDTGSTDDTLTIAKGYSNVQIFERPFEGFGPTKNLAASLASHDWVFSIDSDEVLTPELYWEISHLELDASQVYRVPRQSYYNRKMIKGCGWYPDRVLRLYHRGKTRFNDNQVHESVQVPEGMTVVELEGRLKHYPYDSVDSLIEKAQLYSRLYAEQNEGRLESSPKKAITHGLAAFIKGYVVRRGYQDGYEGFVISLAQGLAAFLKYIKLYEANKRHHL
ncbi:MAG: glycosyltransferase family 2 protein [Candidatus Nitronauta litoralis]|uniref:Glycosyltransferase family 2 protein n=1 Tax=Candidatus Nitronauta litoralis TaxID=2705533 RepID=A0A7T0BU45_9BACT|nr:MAG: glycosyltransferase family 2 protein [Candidatus Nitronauta litoralis]